MEYVNIKKYANNVSINTLFSYLFLKKNVNQNNKRTINFVLIAAQRNQI